MGGTPQRITAIEIQEKRPNRRSIFLDGKFALGVDAEIVAELGLHVGLTIGAKELEDIIRAGLLAKARQKALNLLGYRQRSRAEIARRLARGGFAEDVIGDTLAHLERLGLIDDEQFSRDWVGSRLTGKRIGRARIKWELRQKGVPNDVVEEALSQVDPETEYELALDAARCRLEKVKSADERSRRQKLVSYLRRQGFGWEIISRILDELRVEAE